MIKYDNTQLYNGFVRIYIALQHTLPCIALLRMWCKRGISSVCTEEAATSCMTWLCCDEHYNLPVKLWVDFVRTCPTARRSMTHKSWVMQGADPGGSWLCSCCKRILWGVQCPPDQPFQVSAEGPPDSESRGEPHNERRVWPLHAEGDSWATRDTRQDHARPHCLWPVCSGMHLLLLLPL